MQCDDRHSREKAKALRAQGMSYAAIGHAIGQNWAWVRRACDPKSDERSVELARIREEKKMIADKRRAEARRMFATGMNYSEIAGVLKVHASWVRLQCNDEAAELDRERRRTSSSKLAIPRSAGPNSIKPDEIAARLAQVPPDTRTLTAFAFGDPLPGRSALDRMRAANGR